MAANPGISQGDLAKELGWLDGKGMPLKSKVNRRIKALDDQKLVAKELGAWKLTPAGTKAAANKGAV